MMISALISLENLQNINVCLRSVKMNGYTEAPGQTSLLKMSKVVVRPIGPDPTLFPHSLVAPTPPPLPPFSVPRGGGRGRPPNK